MGLLIDSSRPAPQRSLRQRIEASEFTLLPAVYDGLTTRICEHLGFEALYLTGGGTALIKGLPDVGLTSMSELTAAIRGVTEVSDLPLLVDAETGFGNPVNVRRTVSEYERAGAAGMHIEDQAFPKKCGFLQGKEVVPTVEFVEKIRAAVDARIAAETVIVARTDALQVYGWDEVEARCTAYYEAGADVVFVDGVQRSELETYCRRIVEPGLPTLYNGTDLSAAEAEQLGFRLQIQAVAIYVSYRAVYAALETLKQTGRKPRLPDDVPQVPPITEIVGLPQVYELEAEYGITHAESAEDRAWEVAFERLRQFTEREGTSAVAADHLEDGFELGAWVDSQRALSQEIGGRGEVLTAERRRALSALPGWDWSRGRTI